MTNGRYNIGILINGIDDEFANAVCKGASEAAELFDVDLMLFPGNNFQTNISTTTDMLLNSQYATVFDYAAPKDLDAVIISFSTIYVDQDCEEAQALQKRFEGIPIVTLCLEKEGCGCVRYDAAEGLTELIEHLIHEHDCRRIAFVSGRKGNGDSDLRLDTYIKTLQANGIEYDENMVAEGNFTTDSYKQIDDLLARQTVRPDAICCANDRLAACAYRVAADRGLIVGRDIIITGYDNVILSSSVIPSLTTVNANPAIIGEHAVRLALDMISDPTPRTISLKTSPVIRKSCGIHRSPTQRREFERGEAEFGALEPCLSTLRPDSSIPYSFADDIVPFMDKLMQQMESACTAELDTSELVRMFENGVKDHVTDALSASTLCDYLRSLKLETAKRCESDAKLIQFYELITELYASVCSFLVTLIYRQLQGNTTRDFFISHVMSYINANANSSFAEIMKQLCRLELKNSYLYLSAAPVLIEDPTVAKTFDRLSLRAYHYGSDCRIPKDDITVERESIFTNKCVNRSRRGTFITIPLFTMNEQLGIMVYDLPFGFLDYINVITRHLSSALESLGMLNRLNDRLEDIETRNTLLSALALKDALTGQYNRYGFFEHAEIIARDPENANKTAYVAFVDMDNLKITNDTYGHDDGDYALCLINRALISTFNSGSVIGRIGGDEFAVFTIPDRGDNERTMKLRLHSVLTALNDQSSKPYNVTASIGFARFRCTANTIMRSHLEQADKKLYVSKSQKPTEIEKKKSGNGNAEG